MTGAVLAPGAVAAAMPLLSDDQVVELDKLVEGIEDPVAYQVAVTRYLRWKLGDELLERVARQSSLFPE